MPRMLGLLPATPARARLKLSQFLDVAAAPAAPASADWLSQVGSWPMYLNDRIGDCGPASVAHHYMAVSAAAGNPLTFTDDDVVDLYSRVAGYDRRTGAHDDGVIMQDMLDEVRKNGIAGRKPVAFAAVDVADQAEVDAAVALFGGVLIGANLPIAAEAQINSGKPWDVASGSKGAPGSWGGHAVNIGKYDDPADRLRCITWGQTQDLTERWWTRYVSEAWVLITPEWVDANGRTPSGLDLHGLGEAFAALTGEDNPFPAAPPEPDPTPTPDPDPTPPVDPQPVPPVTPTDADTALVAAFTAWRDAKGI